MPSPLDDLPVHQTVAPLPEPATSDTHFNDGYYFAFYAPGFHVFAGLRLHPNTNVMDGYGGAVAHGTQRNLRVSRALRPSTYPFKIGPLQLEILEPMRRQRVALQANESGVSFDVTFTAVAPPFDETPHRQYRHGRLHNHVLRYTQVARAHGTLTIDDATHPVDGWHAARDHSWGIRSTMGPHIPARGIGPGSDPDRRALRLWVPFETPDHSGFFHTHEDAQGNTLDFEGRIDFKDGGSRALARVKHDLTYEADRLSRGTLALSDETDTTRSYAFEVACEPAHPQGFGYTRGWSDGGQPGVYRGEYMTEHERFDVTQPNAAPEHVPDTRRLGGTEFACTLVSGGMAHVEHMRYARV
jgi:hypothetical protein